MKERIVWLDVVRLVAMFTVVMCHCCDPFNCVPGITDDSLKLCGAVYGTLVRPCVPLFVMITGALLLHVRHDAGTFYRRRIPRVVWPFVIWTIIFCAFPWLTGLAGLPAEVVKTCFPYASEECLAQTFGWSLKSLGLSFINFGEIDGHMWYIYFLIGLYLYMPIFSAWVERASERAKLWFLAAWGVTLFVPYLREFASPYIWGSCSWNEFYALYYFAGFNGYLLAGHMLRRHEQPLWRVLLFGIPAFAVGYAVTFFGYRYMSANPASTTEQLELFFYYLSPNVVLMTLPVFALCQKVKHLPEHTEKLLANLTLCGFGIYMCHFFLTGPSIWLMRKAGVALYAQIPLAAVLTFVIAWAFVDLVHRILKSKAKYFVG